VRYLRWPLRIAAALAVLYVYFAVLHPGQRLPDHVFFERPGPRAIAHRGGLGLWPENTLLALENAQALGVDVLEMDLRATADGVIVLMHDRTVDRTTDGSGPVGQMRFAELRELDAGYRFRNASGQFAYRGQGLTVPRLDEVLSRFPNARLNVEMKQGDFGAALCALLKDYAATGRVLVASFDHRAMSAFRERCPSVATSATAREAVTFYQLNRMRLLSLYRSPAVALQVPEFVRGRRVVDAGFVESAAALNLQVEVWTANTESDMRRLLNLGVQGILTDYPDRLLRLMDRLPANYDSSDESAALSGRSRRGSGACPGGAGRLDGVQSGFFRAGHFARDRNGEAGRVQQGVPHGVP
jgi:glycerophosphoryl diester phosphodiesterase